MGFEYGGKQFDDDGLPVTPPPTYPGAQPYQAQPYPGQQPAQFAQPYAQPAQAYQQPQPYQAQQPYPGQQSAQFAQPVQPYGQPAQFVQPVVGYAVAPKSMGVAAVLAFFLGQFGAHNFYLGYTMKGLVQLGMTILGWITAIIGIGVVLLGVVGLWVFVEFIMILTRSSSMGRDSRGVPLS